MGIADGGEVVVLVIVAHHRHQYLRLWYCPPAATAIPPSPLQDWGEVLGCDHHDEAQGQMVLFDTL